VAHGTGSPEDSEIMSVRYLKRVKMEFDFRWGVPERARLPKGFHWRPWSPQLIRTHADVKFRSFRNELDSLVFPALGTYSGCENLMQGMSKHSGFLPQATWLIEAEGGSLSGPIPCGTIQGLERSTTLGTIQNVGVIPAYRGKGLGRALLLKALAGFRSCGLLRVTLEVTEENEPAMRLYESIGFRAISTSYREVEFPFETTE